jgi:hypothetical protein
MNCPECHDDDSSTLRFGKPHIAEKSSFIGGERFSIIVYFVGAIDWHEFFTLRDGRTIVNEHWALVGTACWACHLILLTVGSPT